MECKHNTADGCNAYPHRTKCIGKACECFVPEEDYQAYIDELHKQVEDLKIKLLKAEFDAEIYKEAILKAFMKWSDKEN